MRACHLVVATGPFHRPYLPAASREFDPNVPQMHSAHYRRPADVPDGGVLIVSGGNSAAQLAVELANAGRRVTIASPRPPWYLPERILGISLYWWIYLAGILNAGRDARVCRYLRGRGEAIIGTQLRRLVRSGRVTLVPQRVTGAHGHNAYLANGGAVAVDSVLWCTGFRPDTTWIDVPGATDADGAPVHDRGAATVPGLHWIGLPWQTRLNSSLIDGVDRDARATAQRIIAATR